MTSIHLKRAGFNTSGVLDGAVTTHYGGEITEACSVFVLLYLPNLVTSLN